MTTIEGFSRYIIYENGDVISIESGILLKPWKHNQGYKIIDLINDNGEKKHMRLHRLLGLTFIPNPLNKPYIDHIDENKTNNHLSNLRWATHAENRQNIKQPNKNNKLNEKNISIEIIGKYTYYRFKKIINGKLHDKLFKTLEEAKKYRDEFISNLSNSGK